jgi:hypothetical protein
MSFYNSELESTILNKISSLKGLMAGGISRRGNGYKIDGR